MVKEAPEIIKKLVETFKENQHIYKNSKVFDEENTKTDFINPFFEALGWDVTNKENIAPQYKDVVFEDTIKIGGKAKAPDYSFRIGGQRIFFVEAKKPSVDIEKNKNPAFQIRRYGWSAGLPLCILTDFEELAVYETNQRPYKNQKASIGRIKYYTYDQYVDKWDEIYNIFSKEAVKTGKFDNYANNLTGIKKGTTKVDDEFLKELDEWREILAKNIALRNKNLSLNQLNYAVQQTIDRIIFLRMAEDRGIEKYGQLKKLIELSNDNKNEYLVYEGFIEICKKADKKYNSGLFHFKNEKDININADQITPFLKIDDDKLKTIFKRLYYPECPYEFSVISPEILGNVYEQFLGKIIKLTPSHQAKITEKDDVKKAGGVYYTPQYIVEYIVKNTIGNILKNKTPNQVSKLHFIDPACGSGSFLLGAYQYLLDWHLNYYSKLERPPKKVLVKDKNGYHEVYQEVIYKGKDGIPRLTIKEKKRIILNNIYGVDIDSSAVEVTKLSLLLKVLEDQNKDEVEQQQTLFQERALPYLGDNIKCGNSLINTEMLKNEDYSIDEIININPFNWEEQFNEVFKEGGFDAVIGNPPYVKERTNKNAFKGLKNSKYYQGKMDLWYLFGCKALDITKKNGLISFIATNNWTTSFGAYKFRNKVNTEATFKEFIDFGNYKVFENASIQTMIYIMKKSNKNDNYTFNYSKYLNDKLSKKESKILLNQKDDKNNIKSFRVSYNRKDNKNNYFNFVPENIDKILNKIKNQKGIEKLNKKEVSQGIVPPQDFLNKKGAEKLKRKDIGTGIFVLSEEEKNNIPFNKNELEIIKPYFTTEELKRYYSNPNNKYWIIYTKSDINKKIKEYPNIKKHLNQFKDIITSDNKPYGLHRARKEEIFTNEKIIVTRKCSIPTFSYLKIN